MSFRLGSVPSPSIGNETYTDCTRQLRPLLVVIATYLSRYTPSRRVFMVLVMAVVLCRSNGKALSTPPGLRGAPRVTIKNEPVSTVPSHHGKKITARSAKHYACAEPPRKVVWKENFERFAISISTCVCVCVCVCVCECFFSSLLSKL